MARIGTGSGGGPEGVIEKGLDWIDRADRPLFLFLYIMDPHSDYRSPEPFNGLFEPGLPWKGSGGNGEGRLF